MQYEKKTNNTKLSLWYEWLPKIRLEDFSLDDRSEVCISAIFVKNEPLSIPEKDFKRIKHESVIGTINWAM